MSQGPTPGTVQRNANQHFDCVSCALSDQKEEDVMVLNA